MQVTKDDKTPPHIGLSDDVKQKFLAQAKKDPTDKITSAMRRLSEWAAQGHYPTGLNHSDLKWMYDQYADELHHRDKNSTAGGNFPPDKATKSANQPDVSVEKCKSLTDALATVKEEAEAKMGKSLLNKFLDFIQKFQTPSSENNVQESSTDFGILLQYLDDISKAGRKMSGNRLDSLKDIHQKLGGLIDDLDNNGTPTEQGDDGLNIDKSKLPEDIRKYLDEIEKRATEAEAKVEELTKTAAAGSSQTEDDILKANLPEPLRKRFEEMEKKAQAAEEIAKRERDERMTREYIAKAREFQGLAVNADEFGAVLKKLAESAPDEYAKVADVLKAADEAIAKGKLFAEVGNNGSGSDQGAYGELVAKADEIRKTEPNLTKEQAIAKAAELYPEIVQKHQREVR